MKETRNKGAIIEELAAKRGLSIQGDSDLKFFAGGTLNLTAIAAIQAYYLGLLLFLQFVRLGINLLEAAMSGPSLSSFAQFAEGTSSSDISGTPGTSQNVPTVVVPNLSGIRYLGPMPAGREMPFFSGANISEFLERYEAQCEEYAVKGNAVIEKLPQYCELTIRLYIRTIPEWKDRNWEELKKVLKEEYRQDDSLQQMMTLGFLRALQEKGCTAGTTVRVYCRQYSYVSTTLVEKGILSHYSQCVGFLRGLPVQVREKIVRKHNIDLDRPETMSFKKLLGSVQHQYTAERTNELLMERVESREIWSEMVDQVQAKIAVPKEERLAPPIRTINEPVNTKPSSAPSILDQQMEELTRNMSALVLAQRAAIQAGSIVGNPNVRIGRPSIQAQNAVVPVGTVGVRRPPFQGCYYCAGEHSEWRCQQKDQDIA
jgi:hypothetical protein